jgi:hypothetical protein
LYPLLKNTLGKAGASLSQQTHSSEERGNSISSHRQSCLQLQVIAHPGANCSIHIKCCITDHWTRGSHNQAGQSR